MYWLVPASPRNPRRRALHRVPQDREADVQRAVRGACAAGATCAGLCARWPEPGRVPRRASRVRTNSPRRSYLTIVKRLTATKGIAGVLDGFFPWGALQAVAKGAVFSWGQAACAKALHTTAGLNKETKTVISGGVGGLVQGLVMSPLLLLKTRVMTDPVFRTSGGIVATAIASAKVGRCHGGGRACEQGARVAFATSLPHPRRRRRFAQVGGRIIASEGATGLFKGVSVFAFKRAADWSTRCAPDAPTLDPPSLCSTSAATTARRAAANGWRMPRPLLPRRSPHDGAAALPQMDDDAFPANAIRAVPPPRAPQVPVRRHGRGGDARDAAEQAVGRPAGDRVARGCVTQHATGERVAHGGGVCVGCDP